MDLFHVAVTFISLLMMDCRAYQDISCPVKDKPLGMMDGTIKDWQISSSSTYPAGWDKNCHEKYARPLIKDKRGWCALFKSSSEWLMVDLGVTAKVTGVLIQGRADGKEWVEVFMLSYTLNGTDFEYATDQYGNNKVFEGNTDSDTIRHVYLDQPIVTRFIRFHTIHWHNHPSMRVEILGCQPCREPLGLPPYGKITVSSESKGKRKKSSCKAQDGHVLSSKSWCAKYKREDEWIQIDVGPPTLITTLVTRGRGDSRKEHWVSEYRISYSNDTRIWHYYKDQRNLESKVFGGNSDKLLERMHYLNSPFVARFVRFHPVQWQGRIAMRVGVLGCPHQGECGDGFLRVLPETQCVENIAFRKNSYINNKRHRKRDTHRTWERGYASRAVDGDLGSDIHKCVILDNRKAEHPVWMVDLETQTKVAGVVLSSFKGGTGSQGEIDKLKDYTENLEKIAVYVDDKTGRAAKSVAGQLCGFVTKLNNALQRPRIHIQCFQPLAGRYVYLEAWGAENKHASVFSAVLCEVEVYS